MNGIPAPHDSFGRETPGHGFAAPAGAGDGVAGLDGCQVLSALQWWGHNPSVRPRGRRRPAGSLGRVGGRQEREGAANGKNWRKCLFTRGVSPRKGRAGQGTGRYSWLAPQWGLAASHPTTHPLGSQFAARRGCEPQTGTQEGIHYWGPGVSQHLAELKPNLFFRTAPENQPRTTMVPAKVGCHHHR